MSGRGGQSRGGGRGGGQMAYRPRGGGGVGGGGGIGGGGSTSVVGGASAPDQRVARIEDTLQSKQAKPDLGAPMPTRPCFGTKGRSVTLWSNYVELKVPPQLTLYRYDIAVEAPASSKGPPVGKKLMQVVRLLLETPELAPMQKDIVTDFSATLISRTRIADQTIDVPYRANIDEDPFDGGPVYRATLRLTNTLSPGLLADYLNQTDDKAVFDDKLPLLQAFSIFLNHYAKTTDGLSSLVASTGMYKTFALNTQDTMDLGACLVALRGFCARVRAATGRILVNINTSHGTFYQAGPLDALIMRYHATKRSLYRTETFIKRLRVETSHLPVKKNKKGRVVPHIKTICGFAKPRDGHQLEKPPRVESVGAGPHNVSFYFDPSSGSSASAAPGKKGAAKGAAKGPALAAGYVTVYEYFLKAYNIRLKDPSLPVINVGSAAYPSYLPAEVCSVLPGQMANVQLDAGQMQNMMQLAVRPPRLNQLSIQGEGLETTGLSATTNPRLVQFGITAGTSLITVPGRVLDSPRLSFGAKEVVMPAAGKWNMVSRKAPIKFSVPAVSAPANPIRWAFLFLNMHNYDGCRVFNKPDELVKPCNDFVSVLRSCGIAMPNAQMPIVAKMRDDDDSAVLEAAFTQANERGIRLLVVILPKTPVPVYNRVKQLGDRVFGIQTVCVVGSKFSPFDRGANGVQVAKDGSDQYLRNVALKINLKLGGSNQAIDPASLGVVGEGKTMVVGLDVTHPSPGSSSNAPSIAGMVASVDNKLGQWPGVLSVQEKARTEMVSSLGDMLKSRLALWRDKNKALPENLLVYRDGVSEGQYQLVLNEELPQLRAACRSMYAATQTAKGLPRITLVVVGKRHHTRFYATDDNETDRSGNTRCGTVVDRGVTEARNWDFFLQAHTALKGTARPGHYYVVLDEIFRSKYGAAAGSAGLSNVADRLEDLTQKMCYMFGRATTAVSICTPAYYADILCERARCYLNNLFDDVSSTRSGASEATQVAVAVHERLKNSMFYI